MNLTLATSQLGETPAANPGAAAAAPAERVAIGEGVGASAAGGGRISEEDALQARLDSLRKD